ncbi:hypothetical protein BDR03DRAFT_983010 [Suillus americanus]|nr:hypothetical protein BDR03DRAFT_983010 [Suillus americanus]
MVPTATIALNLLIMELFRDHMMPTSRVRKDKANASSLVRSESRSDLYPETSNPANSRRAQSTPPRSGASSSRIVLENSLNQKATVHDANDECGPEEIIKSPGPQDCRPRIAVKESEDIGHDAPAWFAKEKWTREQMVWLIRGQYQDVLWR